MAARRQSAVEVAGGYVLDYIRSKRDERDANDRVERALAEYDAAVRDYKDRSAARAETKIRLDAYVQAAIDAE